MKAKSLLMMSLITAGSLASQVSAQELSMERVVGSFVNQAMVSTVHELELGVKQAVTNTTHLFTQSSDKVVGQPKVTELVSARLNSSETESERVITGTHE